MLKRLTVYGTVVVAGILTEALWAHPTIPPQADQALQRRDDLLKNKKIVWDVTISEKHSEEFLKEMAPSLDAQRKNLSQSPVSGTVKAPKVNAIHHSSKRVICRDKNLIRITYDYALLDFPTENEETKKEKNGMLVKKGIAYFGEGVGVYLPDIDASREALGTTNIAYVVRYNHHAAYYLSPLLVGGRDFQPPDLVMLCGLNPLMMYWGEPSGWTVVQEDNRFLIIEKRGPVPCLPRDDPLRIRVWLDKKHDFAPYRIEKYTDDPETLESYRMVAREVWQASQYKSVNGLYCVSQFNCTYYIKGHLVNGKLVYSGKRQVAYRMSDMDECDIDKVDFPDYVAIADFSLKGKDPVVWTLDRAVSYSWGQYRRFLNESELKKLFEEQFPAPPQKRSNWLRTLLTYAPPLLIIVIGLWWFWKTRKK